MIRDRIVRPRLPGRHAEVTFPGGVGILLATIGFILAAGVSGLVGGVLLAICWVLLPAVAVFAIGHVVVIGLVPTLPATVPLAVLEAGLFTVLLAPVSRVDARTIVPATLVCTGVLLGGAWIAQAAAGALWAATAALVGLGGIIAYGLYRYELGVRALVTGREDERSERPDAANPLTDRRSTATEGDA